MPEFKVGDRVRRIVEDWPGVVVGGVYTVKEVTTSKYTKSLAIVLKEPNNGKKYDPNYFELVEAAAPTPQVESVSCSFWESA